jgi:cyclic pyranopterin phosphate synthase
MKKKSNLGCGMVDISQKDTTKRLAVASATIRMGQKAFQALLREGSPKGDALETAKIAGIMAAKSTPRIIPLCHPLLLDKVTVQSQIDKKKKAITLTAEVVCHAKTGVEMEALSAVAVAALTVYDMMKALDQGMVISEIKLLRKSGGKSGEFKRTR